MRLEPHVSSAVADYARLYLVVDIANPPVGVDFGEIRDQLLPWADVLSGGNGYIYVKCPSRKALNRARRAVADYLERWGLAHNL